MSKMNPADDLKHRLIRATEFTSRAFTQEAAGADVTALQTLVDAAAREISAAQADLAIMRASR